MRPWFFALAISSQDVDRDDVIKWQYIPRYWSFVRGIHRSPVNFPHKGQWRGALMFSLICPWKNGWVNNRIAGDFRRQHAHYDVTAMTIEHPCLLLPAILDFATTHATSLTINSRNENILVHVIVKTCFSLFYYIANFGCVKHRSL